VLKAIVNFITMLIFAEGLRLLREYGTGELAGALAPRRLPGTPAESEEPFAAINRHVQHSQQLKE